MPKYLITFVLIALLALENNSIYKRLHVKSQHSVETRTIAHYMRPQQHHHLHQSQLPYHIHKRSHELNPPQPPPVENSNSDQQEDEEESEAAAAFQRYLHRQRHMARQIEHQRHHSEEYAHHRQPSSTGQTSQRGTVDEPNLEREDQWGSIPRIWQHLLSANDRMYGDSAATSYANDEESSQQWDELELPLEPIAEEKEEEEKVLNKVNSLEESHQQPNAEQAEDKKGMRCPKCESNRQVEHISEEELTRLRIEFVKQQILEKLRLKERPNVSAVRLPKPIAEGTTIEEEDEQSKNKDLDDYYARTSKKFIFLQREKRECQRLGVKPSICFSFKIDDADADSFDVSTAVLWLFKSKQSKRFKVENDTLSQQQTIVVSEVQQQLDAKYLPIVKTIAIQSVDAQDNWMKIDIEWPIKRWFGNHDLSHLIHISCQSCDVNSMDEMISIDKDYRPFIMVDAQNRRRIARKKRGINCTDGVTECCREKLYISFDEIGWGDWIIQPRGYDAYFCRGSCGSVASVTQSATHHSSFLHKVHRSRQGRNKPLELIPCCTAKQYSSLQLMFMDNNNTATQKTFPNMVVESCGCR